MNRYLPMVLSLISLVIVISGCSTTYEAKPLPFKVPGAYANATDVAGATVAAQAFSDPGGAKEAFGFDIRAAGMLPVQLVFDNQGSHSIEINSAQTFLEDEGGNLWPILDSQTAYDRASKYAETKQIFKESGYHAFLGAAAGAIIGAAVGVVGGDNVAAAAGKGAALGAAAGATLGGAKGYASGDARRVVIDDLNRKTLQNKPIDPKTLTFGFLFFPGESLSAKELRLQLKEVDTGRIHVVKMKF